jgi:hypothetical protein
MFGGDGETSGGKRAQYREVFLGVFDVSPVQAGGGDWVGISPASENNYTTTVYHYQTASRLTTTSCQGEVI